MSGTLWTGRIYDYQKIKEIHPNKLLICVMRFRPRFIVLEKHNIMHLDSLSPSVRLLKSSIARDDWYVFSENFLLELDGSDEAINDGILIRSLLKNGTDVILLCHERPEENCHRKVLPFWLLDESDFGRYKGEIPLTNTIQKRLDL